MDNDDPTAVIEMLNDLKSNTDIQYHNRPSHRYFSSEIVTPTSLHLNANKISALTPVHEGDKSPRKRQKLIGSRESLNNCDTESVPGSPWEWRRLRGEIVSLRTRLSHQEATVQQLHKIRNEIEEVFKKEKNILEMQADNDKQTIKQLELRLESSRKSVQEAREAQAITENEMYLMKLKLEDKINLLVKENAKLLENQKVITTAETSLPPLVSQEQISDSEIKLHLAEKRILDLEQQLKDSRNLQKEIELQNIEIQSLKIKIEKLESERALWEEGKNRYAQSLRNSDLEKELYSAKETIAAMRESVKGKLFLEEQMANIKQRLKHTENVEQQLATLKIEYNQMLEKLNEYESIKIGGRPSTLKKEISRLQKAEIVLISEEGQLRSQLDSVRRENEILQRKFEEAKKVANDTSIATEKLNKLVSRLQKKMLLITRERDSYRQQLDLYEKDISTDSNSNSNMITRITDLERALDGYRDLISKLEADLDVSGTVTSREECQKLREQIQRLEDELQHRALKGDFNCNSRVLHLKINPASIASQQAEEKMQSLMQEIEQLRQHIQCSNSGPIGITSTQTQEISKLKESYDIKITRLKEAFKASSQEYREACYQLFGWRIDRTKERRYKLSSQYAESPDDFLFFQVAEGVDLLETAFSATLEPLIERHLKIQHSVPMFLNAVQSELFSQQTAINIVK